MKLDRGLVAIICLIFTMLCSMVLMVIVPVILAAHWSTWWLLMYVGYLIGGIYMYAQLNEENDEQRKD